MKRLTSHTKRKDKAAPGRPSALPRRNTRQKSGASADVKGDNAPSTGLVSSAGSASHECASSGNLFSTPSVEPRNLGDGHRGPQTSVSSPEPTTAPAIKLRPYQLPVFLDRATGIMVLHWSRQIGKSFTLASWAVDRLLDKLQNNPTWLITVLSNSRDNGAEFVLKCAEVCKLMGMVHGELMRAEEVGDAAVYVEDDQSDDFKYENMRMEVRITIGGKVGRIKVLAANPRTARGFSGDLILDEFAFHEDSAAIWEAAEPILSSNPEFLCRIASTGNGKHNMFYRMVTSGQFKVSRVSRTEAHRQGVKVYDPNTRKPITPDEARTKALDKRAYDQNYELAFNDENMCLLTTELISAAERVLIPIDEQLWSAASLARMYRAEGDLYIGTDIGRNRDLSVVTVLEKVGNTKRVIGMLRMSGVRLPDQQKQLDPVCGMPRFRVFCGDMTGLGLGLVEYLQDAHGHSRILGVNFSSTEPITAALLAEGRKAETARVTEIMATDLLGAFEDRSLEIPVDDELRADLRKPEKITSPGGKVSIAATRDEAGHADHFWSLALAIRAAQAQVGGITTTEGMSVGGNLTVSGVFRPRQWTPQGRVMAAINQLRTHLTYRASQIWTHLRPVRATKIVLQWYSVRLQWTGGVGRCPRVNPGGAL